MKSSTSSKNTEIDKLWVKRVCQGKAIYDWNIPSHRTKAVVEEPTLGQLQKVEFRSECFRDALGAVLRKPTMSERKSYILDLVQAGVSLITVDIYSSMPENLSKSNMRTLELLTWMAEYVPQARPVVLARALTSDLDYLKECKDRNPMLVGLIFQDLSEVRRIVEGWGSFERVLKCLVTQVEEATLMGIDVMAFTENLSITTRKEVRRYVEEVSKAGAKWVGIADTAGRLTPYGSRQLTRFVAATVEATRKHHHINHEIGIVFHGHNDWGNAINNSIAAIGAGATVIDVVTNGVGERVGNTNLIEMVVNIEYRLRALGDIGCKRFDMSKLIDLSKVYARITATKPGFQQPVIGDRIYSTSYGIHGNYYYKVALLAANMRDEGIDECEIETFINEAWRVYSASSPTDFNLTPDVRISQFSGASNVIMRLVRLNLIKDVRDVEKNDKRVQEVLLRAKESWGEMADDDLRSIWMHSSSK